MEKFFIVSPLGLEDILYDELQDKWHQFIPHPFCEDAKIHTGGIELECEMQAGLSLNHHLRGATKILLRLRQRKCKDIPKLYQTIKKIPWKNYLKKYNFKIKATSKKSRLINTAKIEQATIDAITDYFQANKIKDSILEQYKSTQEAIIHIHFDNDLLTISLDTSGSLLYKRQYQQKARYRANAPLRDNIAYLLLRKAWLDRPYQNILPTIIDPMCGSGTFLYEAANFNCPNERAMYYEVFSKRDEFHKSKQKYFSQIIGQDIEKEHIIKNYKHPLVLFEHESIFTKDTDYKKSFVILNPPYGKKVKIKGKTQTIKDIFLQIQDKFEPVIVAMIIPEKDSFHKEFDNKTRFFNNGIWCYFVLKIN